VKKSVILLVMSAFVFVALAGVEVLAASEGIQHVFEPDPCVCN
jgi:hypothetical protein